MLVLLSSHLGKFFPPGFSLRLSEATSAKVRAEEATVYTGGRTWPCPYGTNSVPLQNAGCMHYRVMKPGSKILKESLGG